MNDDKPRKEPENRRSRFVWSSSDIVIIKNPDDIFNGNKEKPAVPASPLPTDPAAPKLKKDNDQQDG